MGIYAMKRAKVNLQILVVDGMVGIVVMNNEKQEVERFVVGSEQVRERVLETLDSELTQIALSQELTSTGDTCNVPKGGRTMPNDARTLPMAWDANARFKRMEETLAHIERRLDEYGQHLDTLFDMMYGVEEKIKDSERRRLEVVR
jgi:hypothetical protein